MTTAQLREWKAALAAKHKQQRQQRGRFVTGTRYELQPGMARISPADTMDEPDGHGAQGEPATTRGRTDGP